MTDAAFLGWAGPHRAADPRAGQAPEATGWPEICDGGAAAALSVVRGRLGSRPRRLVVCAGDAPEWLAAIDAGLRRPGDELVLLPPTVDATPDLAALRDAVGGVAPGRAMVATSAVAPTGAVAPLAEIAARLREGRAGLVVDLTLARWTPLPDLGACGVSAAIGAVDRWDGGRPGTWGIADEPVARPWADPIPAGLLAAEDRLLARLTRLPDVTLWPFGGSPRAHAVVSFAVSGWTSEEAAAVLGDAFGLCVEAGRLTAAPLPIPSRRGSDLLRASLAPCSSPLDADRLVNALDRLGRSVALPACSQ